MLFRYGVNKHIMPGDQSFSEPGIFAAFETNIRLSF